MQPRRTRRHILGASVALLVGLSAAMQLVEPASAVAPRTFYVDSKTGNDSNDGRTTAKAFKTLTKASTVSYGPGDQLLVRAGSTTIGALDIKGAGLSTAPIVVANYGSGAWADINGGDCVTVHADWVQVSSFRARNCTESGFRIWGDHVTVDQVAAVDNIAGVRIEPGASWATVSNSTIGYNSRMAPNTPGTDDDYGANGVIVSGDNATISHNTLDSNVGVSADYGLDGSAIEIWQAVGTRVLNNTAHENLLFTELGGTATNDTQYSGNTVTSTLEKAGFMVTRGGGTFGPVPGTHADNNNVDLTGARSFGISCAPDCGLNILTATYNTIGAASIGYAEGPDGQWTTISGGHNTWNERVNDGYLGMVLDPTDTITYGP